MQRRDEPTRDMAAMIVPQVGQLMETGVAGEPVSAFGL
jgi:hypothetical protein